ncbi:helix-turn-helix domain-containing protein [Citrobacter portucalensis]|uniref:helix-turn-helix domain-containing protein n=1 Tax=Citrobacter portucalensis TaxID=1639133 RepID=UPI00254A24CD|nr:helix-turn-helix domain-containing protein [Citrobacter portucalensis]
MTQYELITLFAKYGYRAFHIKGIDQAFMIALLGYWNHITNECYPSNESIEAACGIRPDNLHRSKKALIAAGLISGKKEDLNKQLGDGKKHSQYVLKIDFIQNKLKAVAESVEQENIIKFKESGADPFAQEKPEQIAPWEEAVEEAVANNFASLPEVGNPTTTPEEQNANNLAITSNAQIRAYAGNPANEPEQEEKPMAIAQDDFEKMMEEAKRLQLERQERIAKRDQQENQSNDDRSPW